MNRPIILVICGKSASGKDSLAKLLKPWLEEEEHPAHIVISDTTRPPRIKERDKVDYYFLTSEQFNIELMDRQYIEHMNFRGWHYGIHKTEIKQDKINIVVVNPKGLEKLKRYRRQYDIIPIYLQDRLIDRLRRSYEREGCWRIEYFRRAFADFLDFRGFKEQISRFPKYIILENENGTERKAKKVLFALEKFGVI